MPKHAPKGKHTNGKLTKNVSAIEILKNGHGGKRAGAGKPPGTRWPSTLAKLAAREKVRQMITAALPELIEPQIANAKGIKYAVIRNKATGKFERVSEERFKALLETGAEDLERIEIWDKEPSVSAFQELMNRALDQTAKPPEEQVHSGGIVLRHEKTD